MGHFQDAPGKPLQQMIFSAKTHQPKPNKHILPRGRLFSLIKSHLKNGHLWIEGSPGTGKTMLATGYCSQNKRPVAWYEFDHLDADPMSFFSVFPQAFLSPTFIETEISPLPKLPPEDMLGLSHFARYFFRQLFSQIKDQWVLVLDNVHIITKDSPILNILVICLEELPIGCRAILTSRTAPPPAFARMRINSNLQVLDSHKLYFTRQEIAKIMSLYDIDPQQQEYVDELEQITSGWAAGLTLLLREHTRISDLENRPIKAGQQELFDYFTEEFFSRFSKTEKELLLLAATLPEINAAYMDKVLKNRRCKDFFKSLSHHNFFTYLLNEKEYLFQFHPLLKEFLERKIGALLPKQLSSDFLEHMADIFLDEKREKDAIDLLYKAECLKKCIALMKKIGSRLLQQGEYKTLFNWQQMLPQDSVNKDPKLLLFFGSAITAFDPPQGVKLLKRSFDLFQKQGNSRAALLACSALTNSIINHFSNLALLDPWIDYLEQKLDPETFPANNSFENETIATSIFRAMVLRRPTHPDLENWLQLVVKYGGMRPALITHYLWTGRFTKARAALDNIYAHADRIGSKLQLSAIKAMELQYYLIMADTDRCIQIIDESLDIMRKSGVRVWEVHFLILGAGCCLNCGEREKAADYLRQVEENIDRARLLERSYFFVVKTLEGLLDGNLSDADQYQESALKLAESVGMPSYTLWCLYGSALVAVFQDNREKAHALFDRVLTLAENPGNPWFLCQRHLGLAYMELRLGRRKEARKHLQEGFSIAQENNYLTFFFFLPQMMEAVTIAALEEKVEVNHVRKIITHWKLTPEHPPIHLDRWPWPVKIYTLGRFSITCHSKRLKGSSQVGHKPIMLLMALIAHGGRQVRKSQLTDLFWPDSQGDEQIAALKITLHRLRKLIGVDDALLQTSDHLSLNPKLCWVDSWQFERLANLALNSSCRDLGEKEQNDMVQKALDVYRGDFLAPFQDEAWSISQRQHLANIAGQLMELHCE